MMRALYPLSLLLVIVSVSGCMGAGADAHVAFDGSGNGNQSEAAACGDEGRLTGNGNVEDGEVTIQLMDPDGTELYDRTFTGKFNVGPEELKGDSGSWKLQADRSGDDLVGDEFKGEYEFRLDC